VTDLPIASSAEYPKILSAAGFQDVMTPLRVFVMIASSECSTTAVSRFRRPSVCF
jgi:hypothetical protein